MKALAIVELEKGEVMDAIQKLAKEKLPKGLQDSFQGGSKVDFLTSPDVANGVQGAKVTFNLK